MQFIIYLILNFMHACTLYSYNFNNTYIRLKLKYINFRCMQLTQFINNITIEEELALAIELEYNPATSI